MKRVALFIGVNPEGKILLQHKTANAPTNANLWVLFGGSIEDGEEPEEAVKREINEELQLKIEPNFFKTYKHEESWGVVERNIFYGDINVSLDQLITILTEGDNVGFFSSGEIESLLINKNHLAIISEFLKSSKYLTNKS